MTKSIGNSVLNLVLSLATTALLVWAISRGKLQSDLKISAIYLTLIGLQLTLNISMIRSWWKSRGKGQTPGPGTST